MSTQILAALQDAYKIFNNHGALAGELAIIVGCQIGGGGNVTDGFVHINGELLPFKGGLISSTVAIVEVPDQRLFQDASLKNVIYTRYATFGSGTDTYAWADFRRPLTLFQLEDRLLQVEKAVPIGLVAIWDRPAEEIPLGWIEHTDMRGNVPVGFNSGDAFFGSLGNSIGSSQVQLTNGQIPSKSINIVVKDPYTGATSSGGFDGGGNTWRDRTISINVGGSDQAHTNIQPSRIVKYIRFVGF